MNPRELFFRHDVRYAWYAGGVNVFLVMDGNNPGIQALNSTFSVDLTTIAYRFAGTDTFCFIVREPDAVEELYSLTGGDNGPFYSYSGGFNVPLFIVKMPATLSTQLEPFSGTNRANSVISYILSRRGY